MIPPYQGADNVFLDLPSAVLGPLFFFGWILFYWLLDRRTSTEPASLD